jgi:hypothetical protein
VRLANNIRKREKRETKDIARIAKKASSNAIRNAFSHGRSVTVQQGKKIVKLYPNGHTEVIMTIENISVMPEKRRYQL